VSRRGWALFVAVGVIWGLPYLLIKTADAGVSVPVLVLARVLVGAVLLLPIAIRRGQLKALLPRWHWVATFAVVEVILPWLLLSAAERRLSSSLSGLLVAAVPVIGVGVARLAGDGEPLTAVRWVGLAVGLGGVALLMGPGASGGGTWPVLQVLGTAACYAVGPVIAERRLAGADGLAVTAACLGLATVLYAPPAALTWPHTLPSAQVLAALAALALVCTALAFVLYFKLISEVGAVRATVITYINPAVAVALGAAVLGEPLTPVIVLSFALILAGSVLATRPSPPPAAPGVRRGSLRPALGPRRPAPGPLARWLARHPRGRGQRWRSDGFRERNRSGVDESAVRRAGLVPQGDTTPQIVSANNISIGECINAESGGRRRLGPAKRVGMEQRHRGARGGWVGPGRSRHRRFRSEPARR
jgi:drug/metabolite transporter (DMT)-like permease